jgi:hypothetical protein
MPLLLALSFALAADPDPDMEGCDLTDRALVKDYNDAAEAHQRGAMREAFIAADKALKRSPNCRGALITGISARLLANEPGFGPMLTRAIAIYPRDAVIRTILAEEAFVDQEFDIALEQATLAREFDPSSV